MLHIVVTVRDLPSMTPQSANRYPRRSPVMRPRSFTKFSSARYEPFPYRGHA